MQSVVSSHPDTVVIEADHTTPVTMEILTYKEYKYVLIYRLALGESIIFYWYLLALIPPE
jgi:hypothetical protein